MRYILENKTIWTHPKGWKGRAPFFLLLEGKVSQLIHYSKLWPFWSPWQVEKQYWGTKIASQVVNLQVFVLGVVCQAILFDWIVQLRIVFAMFISDKNSDGKNAYHKLRLISPGLYIFIRGLRRANNTQTYKCLSFCWNQYNCNFWQPF